VSELGRQLHAFAAHLRDPARSPPPEGIDDRRLAVYRDLFANNIRTLLAGNFPVIRRTVAEDRWVALVRDFFADFRSHTPLFPQIGEEFVRYLQQRQQAGADDPAWLAELVPAHDPHGNLLAGMPAPSPLAWPLAYRWPVHAIGPGQLPDEPPAAPTLLLVRRDAEGEVHFSELSPLVYRLLELLGEDAARTGSETLSRLAEEAQAADRDAFLQEGAAMLERLRGEGVLLGIR
jgi:hypothetical protein